MRVLIINDGAMAFADSTGDLAALQDLVRGLIEPIFTVRSLSRPRYRVTGYANEESWTPGLRPNVYYPRLQTVIVGPIVVTGIDPRGNTVELLAEEFAQVSVHNLPSQPRCLQVRS